MLKEFREFLLRGNVMDLAVAVIVGGAFTTIVKSLTTNLINPLLALFVGKVDLSGIVLTLGTARFKVGSFLNDVINFVIIAFVIFLLLKGITKLRELGHHEAVAEEPVPTKEEAYLKEIRDLLAQQQNK
ncbi:large-conductance mechanosensitive channel protein MscL [Loigolactobacillus coryniformis]|uniref:large-conductance mechanosensitive channel protein MscL n=1 Tax=Loigolactobacillus coryniformis TaxID=1610 RepID=UPI001C5DE3FB|nr:large-conductance mechanosensitive channel protein MscL [Loigolactobacillus coryniformis]MBW4801644.1 large-conductance mechanosensitive channel protein MscL [Loigolactobacillus coryniformis subsp. torquens]MBW4804344.1 large-conductance mechanosensitive channel protein MscL [Loigolactobacillus coryniformis subsp. torquens]